MLNWTADRMAFSLVFKPRHTSPTLFCGLFLSSCFQPRTTFIKTLTLGSGSSRLAVRQAATMTHPWPQHVNTPFIFPLAPREINPLPAWEDFYFAGSKSINFRRWAGFSFERRKGQSFVFRRARFFFFKYFNVVKYFSCIFLKML